MRFPENLKKNGTIGFVAPSFGCTTEPYKSAFANAQKKWKEIPAFCIDMRVATPDKGTYARRTHRHAFRGVIVFAIRRYACVLCLAKNAPERPADLRVFREDKRQLARQTRQMGWRPSTRITKPNVV